MEMILAKNNSDSCGLSDIEPSDKGNRISKYGEHPWLAVIYQKKKFGLSIFCFGSLISAKLILTVAHCYQNPELETKNILVSLGRYNLSDYSEDSTLNRTIESLIVHPEYKKDLRSLGDADLALLQMHDAVR